MKTTLSWAIAFLIALLVGCSSARSFSDSQKFGVKDLTDDPELYNGRAITVVGVLILTSEGTYLFEDCVAASKVDLFKSILLVGKVPPKSFDFIGGRVIVGGDFVSRIPSSAYPYSRLLNINGIESVSKEFCPDIGLEK